MDKVEPETSSKDQKTVKNNEIKFLYSTVAGRETSVDLISCVFGLFVLIFGLFGYVKSGSVISLVSSICISIPIFIASYLTVKQHFYYSFITLVSSIVLLIAMAIRFFKNFVIYPAGIVFILSFMFCLFLAVRLFLFYQSRKQLNASSTSTTNQPSDLEQAANKEESAPTNQ